MVYRDHRGVLQHCIEPMDLPHPTRARYTLSVGQISIILMCPDPVKCDISLLNNPQFGAGLLCQSHIACGADIVRC